MVQNHSKNNTIYLFTLISVPQLSCRSKRVIHTTVSSSQQAAQVQDVAWGCSTPSSIRHCSVRPP